MHSIDNSDFAIGKMNCGQIARCYQWLKYLSFGRALEWRRREYLDEVKNARSVLILGDGDGRFTAEFLGRNKQGIIDFARTQPAYVSAGEATGRATSGRRGRIRFWQADARTMDLQREYDLIVSHFFLDCFTQKDLDALVA